MYIWFVRIIWFIFLYLCLFIFGVHSHFLICLKLKIRSTPKMLVGVAQLFGGARAPSHFFSTLILLINWQRIHKESQLIFLKSVQLYKTIRNSSKINICVHILIVIFIKSLNPSNVKQKYYMVYKTMHLIKIH